MYHEENQRDSRGYAAQRKKVTSNYNMEKKGNYSPSASYNYSPGGSYGTQQHAGGHSSPHQHSKRRNDFQKRDTGSPQTERLVRQNDVIIKLLKEIRDRLPEPLLADVDALRETDETNGVNEVGEDGAFDGSPASPEAESEE